MFFICAPFGPGPLSSNVVPIITVVPTMPTIPNTVSTGSTVATITVTMSDSSTFTGTVALSANPGGIYAISGSSSPFLLIVNPSGPGVGAEGGNIDNVTVVATQ